MRSFSSTIGIRGRWLVLVLAVAVVVLSNKLVAVHGDEKSGKPGNSNSVNDDSNKPASDLHGKKTDKPKDKKSIDEQLRAFLAEQNVSPLDPGPVQDRAKVELGQALFFDWELSGNRDIACATCHHPFFSTGDGLSLPIGTAAVIPGMLGPFRELGTGRLFIPRNAPEVFNRGSNAWTSQFWDSRVALARVGFISPAGNNLPPGLPNVLAVQAMFPVTSRDEMRGRAGDKNANGTPNELAAFADTDLPGIWGALMVRLRAIPGYRSLFAAAYPGVPMENLGFEHAAIAIAAFEADAYTFLDSPWDKYLSGENNALSDDEKRGALLFYGSANCSKCHSGSLLTDQQHYNIGVPQLGPGKGAESPLDFGRGRETHIQADVFRFRTPPLRNCEVTGPYMHNGAYSDLMDAVAHHAAPLKSLLKYNPQKSLDQAAIRSTYKPANQVFVAAGIDYEKLPGKLSEKELRDIVKFLKTLTAPDIQQRMDATIPDSVPSGLPVDR